ncbi:translocation/assembly module TamB domain-containing protein [Afifella sp. IM 167]|uniref:translocation/assembly module TamB domain-containing protein n=1 Tax=Afifella sp. IM 167 TaxID=2033586 RepID=UPI001CD039E6|nr:translocation/assembly module TamB domain-containing protein [Afifella sp. IM 167]MBZ8134997.1 hypothetical protein [Afifella sp. IM 167]
MRRRTALFVVPLLATGVAVVGLAHAQSSSNDEDRSWLQNFLENRLSTPNRQISVGAINGVLSSNPSIASLTISDEAGPWLRAENLSLNWTRSALLRGRLDIDSMRAGSLEVMRRPNPGPDSDSASGEPISFSLPIQVKIAEMAIPKIHLGQPVIGEEADLSLQGSFSYDGDQTLAALNIQRQDRPGDISLDFRLVPDNNELRLEAHLDEPAGGLVATALNVPGGPPINLTIDGDGPLADFAADIALKTGEESRLGGKATVRREDAAYHIAANLSGSLAALASGDGATLLSGESEIALDLLRRDDGSVSLRQARIASDRVKLSAQMELASDLFPERGDIALSLNEGGTGALPLPGFNADASIGLFTLNASLAESDGEGRQAWQVELDAQALDHAEIELQRLTLSGSGNAANLSDAAARSATFSMTANAQGVRPANPDLAQALGPEITASASGNWQSASPVRIEESRIVAGDVNASYTGAASARSLLGKLTAEIGNLGRFSGLAGRDLAGSLDLSADGSVDLKTYGFDLTVDANGAELESGTAPLDALLVGTTRVTGGVARDGEGGLTFRDLVVNSDALQASADGSYSQSAVDLAVRATIDDLSRATDRARGSVTARADLSGTPQEPKIEAVVTGERLVLMEKQLTGAQARFSGTLGSAVSGSFSLAGNLGGVPIEGSGRLEPGEAGAKRLEDLSLTAGAAELSGALAMLANGLFEGELSLQAPNIAQIAPLFLTEAQGAVDLDISLSSENNRQGASVKGTIDGLRVEQARIDNGRIDLTGGDLFGTPSLDGTFAFRGVDAAGFDIRTIDGKAQRSGEATAFTVSADMAEGDASLAGNLAPVQGGFAVGLDRLTFSHQGVRAALAEPTTIQVVNGGATFDRLRLDAGGGSLVVDGSAGDRLDLQIVLDKVNAAVANAFAPDLALAGTLSGKVSVSGTSAAPEPVFDVTWRGANAAPLRQANAGPFDIAAKGNYADGKVDLNATITGGRGERVEARGTIPVSGGGNLDVTANIVSLPAAAINAVKPDLGAQGSITGSAKASGSLAAPRATFDLRWQGASVQQTRDAGLGALTIAAAGSYDNGLVQLQRGSIGNGTLDLSITGTARVTGGQSLDLRINGTAPLALANVQLAERGTAVSGTARIDLAVGGTPSNPRISGTVSTSDGAVTDPDSGIVLRNMALTARFDGDQVSIQNLNANFAPSGRLSGSGTVGLSGAMPISIKLNIVDGRYADGTLLTARFNADLDITGSISAGPTIGGQVRINRVDVTVPETLPGGALALDVEHIHATAAILRTVHMARPRSRPDDGSGGGGVKLDLVIDAPARIFVRGRGLDAELGGRLRLSGPADNVVASGGFQLIRGRLDVLTQRITIDSGELNFIGDLDPYLDFTASTDSGDITVTITISGRASDPSVSFSSVPQLPQDEVLAQLLFGRSIADLSPLQVARLAAAAAELGGVGGGAGIFDRLRAATGLDDLDVVTDSEGNAAVQAGRYINDNIYLGVQSGTDAQSSRVTIDLDIIKGVKARGELGAEGDSALGIAVEHEY